MIMIISKMVMTMVPRTTPVMTTPVKTGKTGKTGKTTPVRTEKAAMSPGKTRKTTPVTLSGHLASL